MNRSFKSKLGKKRSGKKLSGIRQLKSSDSPGSPSTSRDELRPQLLLEDSPYLMSSQAPMPEKEVHWDYDTPQIMKYRTRMGVGVRRDEEGSPPAPIILQEKVSTPKFKLHKTLRPRFLTDLDNSDARAVFDDLKALSHRLDSKKFANSSSSTDISPDLSEESANKSENDLFSDDDSLLIRCTQEAEERLETCHIQNENIENFKEENADFNMDGEDSFDVILSQIEEEDISEMQTTSRKTLTCREGDLRQDNCNAPTLDRVSLQSPVRDRSVKRFKSSDDGVSQKKSPSLRKIRSSPVIPLASLQPRVCTQAQIEEKKLAARRRRQLSQMK